MYFIGVITSTYFHKHFVFVLKLWNVFIHSLKIKNYLNKKIQVIGNVSLLEKFNFYTDLLHENVKTSTISIEMSERESIHQYNDLFVTCLVGFRFVCAHRWY